MKGVAKHCTHTACISGYGVKSVCQTRRQDRHLESAVRVCVNLTVVNRDIPSTTVSASTNVKAV